MNHRTPPAQTEAESTDHDQPVDDAAPEIPRRSGLGLSRMLAAAQSVFGDAEEEDAPVIPSEDLPDELPIVGGYRYNS